MKNELLKGLTKEQIAKVKASPVPEPSSSVAPSSSSSVIPSSSSSSDPQSSSSSAEPIPEPQFDPVFSQGTLSEKKLRTFNLTKTHTLSEEDKEKIEKYDISEKTYHYADNYKYDYYLTLEEYFDIIKTNAKDGFKFDISNDNYIYEIDLLDSQNRSICYATIDIENRVIDYKGLIEPAINVAPETDYSTYSLYLDVRYEDTHTIPYSDRVKRNSFKYIDYDIYKEDEKVYFPLSLLNAHFNKDFDINYIFDENNMYFYDDDSQIKI